MKIAIASMNEQTIAAHFGRAEKYMVFSVEDGQITDRKMLPKLGHRHFASQDSGKHNRGSGKHNRGSGTKGSGFGHHANCKHEQMIENIRDCDVLLTGGMGRGAYQDLQKWGIKPIVTDITDVETAVQAVLDDTIIDHTDKLH